MAKSKKFDYRITQEKSSWRAEITRRVTSKKTIVSKSQTGFTSEADAEQWGRQELESFLHSLKNRNKRHSTQRELKAIKNKVDAV